MSREVRHCRNCVHCRAVGNEAAGTFRAWCRMGMWETVSRSPKRWGHLFWYRTLRAIFDRRNARLRKLARTCPYYNAVPPDLSRDEFLSPPT